ncbi:MAG: tetratricopeptide repeat protein [Zhaonellaceae bacterium]|jgi:CII-binding regulator of phage lambda lysogenization HflD|nr:hypothetical protein [Clostridia bacterium]
MAYYSNIFVPGVKYARTPKMGIRIELNQEVKQEVKEGVKQEVKREEFESPKVSSKATTDQEGKGGLLQEAIKLHDKGALENDKEAVIKAHALLKKLSRANPEDPVVNAYYGSAVTLMARDGSDPIRRMKDVKKGLSILDGVVSNAPDVIQARILRGNVCFRLPETMFRRNSTAVEDFNYLIKRYEQNNSVFSQDFYLQLLDNLSQAYKNVGRNEESKKVLGKRQSISGGKVALQDSTVKKEVKKEGTSKELSGPAGQLSKIPAEILANIPPNFLANLPPNIREQLNAFLQNVPASSSQQEAGEEEPKVSAEERETLVNEGKKIYAKVRTGSPQDRLKAFNFLREAHETIPEDNTIAAYYADCLIRMGMESNDMGSMFPNLFKGMKILNKALESEPENIELRFLRGYLAFRLPEAFFHRTATAKEDFEYLISRYEEDNGVFSSETYWQVLYDLALVYKRLNMEEEFKVALGKLQTKNSKLYNQMAEVGKRIARCEYNRLHPLEEFFFLP